MNLAFVWLGLGFVTGLNLAALTVALLRRDFRWISLRLMAIGMSVLSVTVLLGVLL